MYELFYGLDESPFSLTPDSRFLFLSEQHRAAMAALLYGIEQRRGFICLTGEIGSGKTTLCRALANRLRTRAIRIGVILNSYLSDIELLRTINDEFGIESHFDSKKDLIDALNHFVIEENRQGTICAMIIDEAQNLPIPTLEQIRMLGNLESETTKLLQVVLVGQPQLSEILARPEMEQFDQRIAVRYHLNPLSNDELLHYIRHRLLVAGSKRHIEFSAAALDKIAVFSRGIPRRINQVCDRCLLIGFVADSYSIDGVMVDQAIAEVTGHATHPQPPLPRPIVHHWKIAATLGISLSLLGGALWLTLGNNAQSPASAPSFAGARGAKKSPATKAARHHHSSGQQKAGAKNLASMAATAPLTSATTSSPTSAASRTSMPTTQHNAATLPLSGSGANPATTATLPLQPGKMAEKKITTSAPVANATPTPTSTPTPKPAPAPKATPTPAPTPTPKTASVASMPINVGGVLLSDQAPAIAPAPSTSLAAIVRAQAASAPTSAPAVAGGEADSWTYDKDGIVRVAHPPVAKLASVMTIARLWNAPGDLNALRAQPPEKLAALDPLAYAKDHLKLSVIDCSGDFPGAVKHNMPLLVEFADPLPSQCRFAVISGIYGNDWFVADPVQGLKKMTLEKLVRATSHLWVLYKDEDNLVKFAPGDTDSHILKVQQFLEKQGLLAGAPTSYYGDSMRSALRSYQRRLKLPQSGLLDAPTVQAMISAQAPEAAKLLKK